MPLQATSGAASYDAFGGGVPVVLNYIEDVFSTWLYTGNGSTQTITNGVDLSGKGGLVWCKIRNTSDAHALFDTARGFPNWLVSNTTGAQNAFGTPDSTDMVATSTGFSMNNISSASNTWNSSGNTFASWTFRKQPKFFDVVTFTFASGSPFTFNHSLNSTPGCIIFKRTDSTSNWITYHRGLNGNVSPNEWKINLNTTAAQSNEGLEWLTSITSTSVTISTDYFASGGTYVAYLFAHDEGGFGPTGTDNVISCGGYTGNGSTNSITVGFEPQWLMIKRTNNTGSWHMMDIMRQMPLSGNSNGFTANSSAAEGGAYRINPTATGFQIRSETAAEINSNTSTYIYIAIRRGPMKVPTTGTSVFSTDYYQGPDSPPAWNSGFVTDLGIYKDRTGGASKTFDRLRGALELQMNSTGAESADDATGKFDYMNGYAQYSGSVNTTLPSWMFRRAPGYMDLVCYTGTGSNRTLSHNLGVVPELMIVKSRSGANGWAVYTSAVGNTKALFLNTTATPDTWDAYWNDTTPTSSVFTVGTGSPVNQSSVTYVAYLFASCPGVSKVGSYTGTGTTQTINCGFTGGARFVLIKRTDSTGDWYVWDSLRGIVSGNDPYLLLNNVNAEVTNTDYIDTASTGFEISSTAPAAINASGGSFIFLAIS